MGATAGHPLVQQVRQNIAQAEPASKLNPRELAEDKANNVGGFVKSRQNPAGGPQLSNEEWERHLRHDDPEAPYLLPQQKGAIHLNFKVFLADSQQHKLHVARTLIHEASHKFVDTYDFAYTHDPAYLTLSKPQAMRNADSYAFAAASCYKGRLFRDKTHMMRASGDMDS